MSLVISGDASHITSPLAATIVGLADNGSGAVRAQTSAPHLFASGDYVHVVTITTVIDAYFVIDVIDATHFDLVGSTYVGTGTGTATDASLTPAIQVPTDGDTASLQLSGMLSALQALADRTQALAKSGVQRSMHVVFVSASGSVVVPPWVTHVMIFGCGGGGGGGGGMGGYLGTANQQFASGGGGAGANLGMNLATKSSATSLDVTIGAGGAGGAGSAGGASPSSATGGTRGDTTSISRHDGPLFGIPIATFYGGSGGGAGSSEVNAASSNVPVYTPGGEAGPTFRNGAASKRSRLAPGPRQLINIDNAAGTLSVPSGAWPTRVYTDPVGQMNYGDGGASMATAGNATYAAGVSYDGAASVSAFDGGSAGAEGTADGIWPGGAGGGGGGGGPFAQGAGGGAGGDGSSGTGATNGANGSTTGGGAGGGGGGGGGNGNTTTAGNGGTGGTGGGGSVWIVFLTSE